ncbi:hypothetical protein [Paradevosia shaoguanensis]|uniref:hypothetical protein n=1 Tax=Paradevosia shaoguanensis TaxID=1335043 RepID=UPI000455BCB7|nr:hypothetical protein [Paradevosia shaoguanensis]CDP50678.1 hypothetical protein [Devosia sp. DBB001]
MEPFTTLPGGTAVWTPAQQQEMYGRASSLALSAMMVVAILVVAGVVALLGGWHG